VILPRWIPRPIAWANAVALFVFATALSKALTFVLPILMALMRHSPRLAWLGMLLVWLSPIAAAAGIHTVVDRVIGLGESRSTSRRGWVGGAASWWAGFVAWAAIVFVTMTTAIVTVIFDPPPIDSDVAWNLVDAFARGVSGIERSVVWIVLAAYVYELERAASITSGGRRDS
jgi:hypothetical protein